MHTDLLSQGEQSIFSPQGPAAGTLSTLGITLTVIAVLVLAIMTVLVVIALLPRREIPAPGSVPLDEFERRARPGVRWIVIGTIITILILVFAAGYSIKVLVDYPAQLNASTMTIRVTGYQYWWKVEYLDSAGHAQIVDANELHIPAGTRVKLDLGSADVIHSFWVPGLAGKTDLIPGLHTSMWIEADHPASYRGQCSEYCGMSHANMRLDVIATSPQGFAAWKASHVEIPQADTGTTRIFNAHGCGACHSLTGQMHGNAGPDLTHFAQRATIAAGVITNTPDHLRAWLADPQSIKPGTLMPRTGLTSAELDRVVAYLESLK